MFPKSNGIHVRHGILWIWILLPGLLPTPASAVGPDEISQPWLLVDTREQTLSVMHGTQATMTLHNIAIGRYGASPEKRRGDNNTPLGRFRVTRIEHKSGFHRFIGLDYPDAERAQRAFHEGEIGQRELEKILAAHRRGNAPPQHTALGGLIGIHGLGSADPDLHERVNWTKGCVALTNKQVDSLLTWVRTGMTVEIR